MIRRHDNIRVRGRLQQCRSGNAAEIMLYVRIIAVEAALQQCRSGNAAEMTEYKPLGG